MKRVAIILSGCGVYDGTEITESVLTLLALEQADAQYQCFAPNMNQHHVIDHITGEEMPETRNVLVESARIARGEVQDLKLAKAQDFDALIIPGGFGAAKNLCDFAFSGENTQVHPEVARMVADMRQADKPLGFICIAPAMIPKLYPQNTQLSIGQDKETVAKIEKMGGVHINCLVQDIVIDKAHKVVSTPAYMLANSIIEAQQGITKLVAAVLNMS